MPHDWNALSAPFSFEDVNWRASRLSKKNPQQWKTQPLVYLDARNVMERLDAVVGPENWQDKYYEARGLLVCHIAINVEGQWIEKGDGAGNTDIEAEKGALSDAFKRAAVRWGIGRYLYDIGDLPWVEVEMYKSGNEWKSSGKIAKHEMNKLRNIYERLVEGKSLPPVEVIDGPSDDLKRLSDSIADTEPEDTPQWMKDNLEAIDALNEDEKLVIRRMCNQKLAKRQKAA